MDDRTQHALAKNAAQFCWRVRGNPLALPAKTLTQASGVMRTLEDYSPGTHYVVCPTGAEERSTAPLKDSPRLFETFMSLDGSPESICSFASVHGLLGPPVTVLLADQRQAEPIAIWQHEI